jgi:SSS family solute:Na+ symporter
MVSGLFVPTLAAHFWPGRRPAAAMASMLCGGVTTLGVKAGAVPLPARLAKAGFDPVIYGLLASAVVFVAVAMLPARQHRWVSGRPGPQGR